jgi:hypothetical protein
VSTQPGEGHFKEIDNQTWIIERHGYRTPAQVRVEQIGPVLMAA